MWVYLLNYFSLPIYKKIIKHKKTFCFIVSLQLFLILSLRNPMLGTDLQIYSKGFQYISGLSFTELISKLHLIKVADLIFPFSFESGYTILNWLLSKVGFGSQGLLAVCAAINVISIGRFVYKYSDEPALSFAIFISFNMYYYCFGILRQSLALSVMLWAVPYIMDRKYLKAAIVILFAFFMHRTAIVVFPLIILANIKVKKNYFIYTYMVGAILIFAASLIYRTLILRLMQLMNIGYISIDFHINNFTVLIMAIGIIIYLIIDFKVFEIQSLNLSCWAVVLLFLFQPFAMCNETFARATEMYTVFFIVLIPGLIYRYKNKNTRIIGEICVFILMLGFMIYSYSKSEIVPYTVFW